MCCVWRGAALLLLEAVTKHGVGERSEYISPLQSPERGVVGGSLPGVLNYYVTMLEDEVTGLVAELGGEEEECCPQLALDCP